MLSRFALLAVAFSTSLLAQGVVPPFQLGQVNPHPGFSTPNLPAADIQQIHMIHLPSAPPNVFLVGATCNGLFSTSGGVGGLDLLSGSYDVLTDTFTPNSEAAALNTTGLDFGLMLHHSGLYAAFDRLPGQPWLASRSAVGQPWQIVGQFSALPSQSYYDPALVDYRGQTWLLHVLGTNIAMTPINLATAGLTGASVIIVRPVRAGATANSPTPVTDPNGQFIGLSHHDLLGQDNDHYMSLDLDPNTPAVLLNDTTTWTNNGAFVGGRFFDAEFTPSPYHVFSMDTFWFTGGRAAINSTMHVTLYSPPTSGPDIYLSMFLASTGFLPTGVSIPGIQGLLGVNSPGLAQSNLVQHNNLNGSVVISFPIPNNPALSGTRLPVQMGTISALAGMAFIGNTALLVVD